MSLLDMIGPVMIGPSSSHTAGACRIGLVGRQLLGTPPVQARASLHASFAKTGKGHGTHQAIVAGLLGYGPDDARLPNAFAEAARANLAFEFTDTDLGEVHPNSAQLDLQSAAGEACSLIASSTGGGVIEVIRVDGFRVSFSGASFTLLIRYTDALGVIARVTALVAAAGVNIAALICSRQKRGGGAMTCLELDGPLSGPALAFLSSWPEMAWVRMVRPVMDAGATIGGGDVPVLTGTTA
ncbi:L-serine ammonia-lyase, iron-sulfur-dependent subunit beta [Deinococcus sp.]|uniref:L-serine ammonia-lyase, iron-sulfur-dependent subunit beta n=1 Tax=Deinococcus sp. TaxID=47478 RepID=UPI0025DA5672|nr:L-serine ammonia-lyase, iron-sulfur-dependent subunit beta [Deinococcus sp.]